MTRSHPSASIVNPSGRKLTGVFDFEADHGCLPRSGDLSMRNVRSPLLVILSAHFLGACATIVTGRNGQVSFTSNPGGATVSVDGRTIGVTPLTTVLPKK